MSLAARLNKRVTIQALVEVQDSIGQPLPADWIDIITDGDGKCWAEVKDVSGKEFIAADAENSKVTTRITIRHRADVTAEMRVLHGENIYNVLAALGQADRTLLLMCERGTA